MQSPQEIASIPLAIIGMGCRLPGADNLDEFWQLIVGGRSAIGELPPDKLDRELYYDPRKGVRGKSYSTLGGLISGRPLDRQLCPLLPELERSVDAVHVRMCEVAAAACRHAKMDPFQLPTRNVGVYIGHAQGSRLSGDYTYATCLEEAAQFLLEVEEFRTLPPEQQRAILQQFITNIRKRLPKQNTDSPDVGASMVAGTIAKAFGLTGPFLALNSACASSLQAMLLAARALQMGRVEMAIVGGASDCKGDSLVLFSNAQAMSATGSRPFDADADGLICGEGYVAVVMKTLEKALVDGDPICAVVRGLGVSSDGRGKSLWAPRKEGQIEAMQQAYRTGLDIARLQYIEAHATATQLGDATELSTLSEVLQEHLPRGNKIPITSVKANIGHTLESAGLAGVIKTVLCMINRTIPPAANVRQLNKKIDWEHASVYIPLQSEPWPEPPDGLPRCAGINAFGIGGLNTHVVLEEFTTASRQLVNVVNRHRLSDRATSSEASRDKDEESSVAVIGLGCILPDALDIQSFWKLLTSARDPKCPAPPDRWRPDLARRPGTQTPFASSMSRGGYITTFQYDWKVHKLPPMQIAQADPLQFMLLEASDQALKDAGYDAKLFDRKRVGVVVGTEFGGDFASQLQMALRLPEMERELTQILESYRVNADLARAIPTKFADRLIAHWPALIDESGSFSTSSLASRITKTWDLMGGAAAIDSGSTSALAALASAVDMLLAGDCDMVVCAAGQRRMSLPAYEMLSSAGVLAKEETPRSLFDVESAGYFPGEGVGALLLKRLADARRDGDPVRAIIRGIGAAHHGSSREAIKMAFERCTETTAVRPADIALLETDAVGLSASDAERLGPIVSNFQEDGRREPLFIGETISQIGHTGGASGMVSMIKAMLELDRRELPAVFNLHHPAPILADVAIQAPTIPLPLNSMTRDGRLIGAVMSSDRDLTYQVLLERGAKVPVAELQIREGAAPAELRQMPRTAAIPSARQEPRPPDDQPELSQNGKQHAASADWRILRLGGSDIEDIRMQIVQKKADTAAAFAGAVNSRFNSIDYFRLAIVADNPAALEEKLTLAADQLGNSSTRAVVESRGIFWRPTSVSRPRIVFLFPGQASQYHGMLRELVHDLPAARSAMKEAERVMAKHGCHTFAEMAWSASGGAEKDSWIIQSSLLMANWIMRAALESRGIRPDLVAGHSYGEYIALAASGVWDFESAMSATRARCEAIARSGVQGAMLATNATPTLVEQLAGRLDEPVYVANLNAPNQIVVGGPNESIADLAELLAREGHQARVLAVPSPFHTPLMKQAAIAFDSALDDIRFDRPFIPFMSAICSRALDDPEEIRANLVAHMTTPIRFEQLIRALADEAPTVFVEVGPHQVLTRLVRGILGQTSGDYIASDNPKRPGVEQLWHVQALLECTGAWEPREDEKRSAISASAISKTAGSKSETLFFDATARRREKMRQAAEAQSYTRIMPETLPSRPISHNGESHEPDIKENTALSPADGSPIARKDSDLEHFLIHFVVEHTGYPPEVVELDADLEADLGIDSIKKAQLFGELREYFDVTPDANMTLDDFPTLRYVLNYLRTAQPARSANPAKTTASTEAHPATTRSTERNAQYTLSTAEKAFTQRKPSLKTAETVAVLDTPVALAEAPDATELESFLIRFVVEHTGYPAEVVELDADLEADLGIDSIKKAQLFGELREYFDVTPDANMTLDDFPTLRHVLNYLRAAESAPHLAPVENWPEDLPGMKSSARGVWDSESENYEIDGFASNEDSLIDKLMNESFQKQPTPPMSDYLSNSLRQSTGPYGKGFHRGQQERQRIRQILHDYADIIGTRWDTTTSTQNPRQLRLSLTPDEHEELQGIADGAEVARENLEAVDLPELTGLLFPDESSVKTDLVEDTEYLPEESLFQPEPQTQRFVMRMIEAPFKDNMPPVPTWCGPALLVGSGSTHEALRDRLESLGVRVFELAPTGDIDADLHAFDTLWNRQPILHVFLTKARDCGTSDLFDVDVWTARRNRGVLAPYFLCQRWLQLADEAELIDKCTLTGVTGLGGDFGFSSNVTAPEGGAITGLVKAIFMEYLILRGHTKMIVKAIDAPDDESPSILAENIVRELAAGTMDYEVAFAGGRRFLQNALHQSAELKPSIRMRRGAVWVVTGGGQGITARCALELGRRFGLHLHLIGSSPFPDIDPSWSNLSEEGRKSLKASVTLQAKASAEPVAKAWERVEKALEIDKSLRTFADAGVQVTYHSCDVSNRKALAKVLDGIRRADGPIEGILHGAGIDRAGRFERKNRSDVKATFGSKVDGARNLMELTAAEPVTYFIAFGSISGRLGGNGQTDYSMASDMLCKLMSWYRAKRPACRAVGFHWHSWDEIGMAAKSEVVATFKKLNAPKLMPVAEGVRHLLREIFAEVPKSEVLITDWDYHQRFYKSGGEEEFRSQSGVKQSVVERFVIRTFDASLPEPSKDTAVLTGPTLIMGDNADARALAEKLGREGLSVRILPMEQDVETSVAKLDEVFREHPARNLFVMTACDPEARHFASERAWMRREDGFFVPFFVIQRWCQLASRLTPISPMTLVAATRLGGRFGFSGEVPAPEGGALTGLVKSLYLENQVKRGQRSVRPGKITAESSADLRLKVIDIAPDSDSSSLAEAIFREVAAGGPEIEVAWTGMRRQVVRTVAQPIEKLQRNDLPQGGTWLITGGARGITAAAALELARRYKLTLHLLGTTPAVRADAPWLQFSAEELKQFKAELVRIALTAGRSPDEDWDRIKRDIEIHNNMQRYAEAGVKAVYHACDVSDWNALARVLEEIRAADGPIQGILHGAGYGLSDRFEYKKASRVRRTVAGKVEGAIALMTLTQQDPLRWFVAFGSLSGRWGGNGLSDYAAANDMLAKLIGWFRQRRPECKSTCCHWQTWGEVGMATLSDDVVIVKNHLKMEFMPAAEGIEHLHQELRAGLPEPEILFSDGHFQRIFYPAETLQPPDNARALGREGSDPDRTENPPEPLIESSRLLENGGMAAEIRFDPSRDPFLAEHRLRGKPFLPGVVGIESIAQAAANWKPESRVTGLSDVSIVAGLLFHNAEPMMAQVNVTQADEGVVCRLTTELRDRKNRLIQAERLHVQASVEFDQQSPLIEEAPPGQPPQGWFPYRYPDEGLMYHGEPFRCLRAFCFQYDGGWGKIESPTGNHLAGSRNAEGWIFPLAVLDACLVACGGFVWMQFGGKFEVPHGFRKLQIARQPRNGEICVLRFYFRGREPEHSTFDFTLFGEHDDVILQAEGYQTISVGEGSG